MRTAALLVIPFLVVVVACGSAPASAPTSPLASLATSAPPAAAKSGTPTSTATDAESCHAAFAKDRPAGWVDAGKLVMSVTDEMPTSWELRDTTGTKVDAGPIAEKSAGKAVKLLAEKACKVGGVLVVYEEKATEGTMVASIVRPAQEDEAADVASLCTMPSTVSAALGGLDEDQKRRVAVEYYETHLGSRKWRAWLFDLNAKIKKEPADAARAAIRRSKSEELDGAAKKPDCWFAGTLRK